MKNLGATKVREFFTSVCADLAPQAARKPAGLIVTHLLPDRPYFIESMATIVDLRAIFPKPKTLDPNVKSFLSHTYPVEVISRDVVSDPDKCLQLVIKYGQGHPIVLADIGGYFANCLNFLASNYPGPFLGVVEDTENGHQKYAAINPKCPVVSVARSPLKNPEDFLVGQSIVFSTEALLRERGDILHGRTACVIGYGKIGRSIANLLHARHVRTVVYDIDPVKCIDAMSHGFFVAPSLEEGLYGAGLVFCATGNHSLKEDHFRHLENGSYVATVTSSEDEIELEKVRKRYNVKHIHDFVTRYSNEVNHFYLLNRGQAVNFIHGAAVGPFIYLIQGEILASIGRLSGGKVANGIHENSCELRQAIANKWLSVFSPNSFKR
ncbi:hypothetical protein KBY84_08030 [Cyanobium sp. N.Huapi 1H5]|uniref:adenosylhomocysteinase n=1 Tax=Cyanobium sp. N.Huapi 1H5 TaxID=2823719 RepID=UPI0020CEAE02|nr:adenosylhomocysteinase [Cyanobium sp. N.Huapi 1H5]MCP9837441.1 hypothetical protein [Cyanobium sp. N.Huapi 1H5]